jgi:hypothetical protein
MDFADDGVAGDADLGGDLTAGQARADKVAELRDALRIPRCGDSCAAHRKGLA